MSKSRRNMHLGAAASTFINAFILRKRQTEAEKILWTRLRDRQVEDTRFRRQHPMKNYVVDNYAHEVKLSIEIDGKYHNEGSQKFYDDDRTTVLTSYGVIIIRFTNEQIFTSLDFVIEEIGATIRALRKAKKQNHSDR